jgi:hypothetical protein
MVAFHNREVIQATLDGIVRLLLAGRLEESKAALLIRACQVAARNFDRTPDLLSGPKPQSHDAPRYFLRLQSLLETVDPVLADALAIELAAAQPPPE